MDAGVSATLIAAVSGLVYVGVDADPVPGSASVVLLVVTLAAFVEVVPAPRRTGTARGGHTEQAGRAAFGRGYRIVVAGEVVAAVAGTAVVTRWGVVVGVGPGMVLLAVAYRRPARGPRRRGPGDSRPAS